MTENLHHAFGCRCANCIASRFQPSPSSSADSTTRAMDATPRDMFEACECGHDWGIHDTRAPNRRCLKCDCDRFATAQTDATSRELTDDNLRQLRRVAFDGRPINARDSLTLIDMVLRSRAVAPSSEGREAATPGVDTEELREQSRAFIGIPGRVMMRAAADEIDRLRLAAAPRESTPRAHPFAGIEPFTDPAIGAALAMADVSAGSFPRLHPILMREQNDGPPVDGHFADDEGNVYQRIEMDEPDEKSVRESTPRAEDETSTRCAHGYLPHDACDECSKAREFVAASSSEGVETQAMDAEQKNHLYWEAIAESELGQEVISLRSRLSTVEAERDELRASAGFEKAWQEAGEKVMALEAERDEMQQRLADVYSDVELPAPDPRHAGKLDPRIEVAQIVVREARSALRDIAKATWGDKLLDISERMGKSHDALYKVNNELVALRASVAAHTNTLNAVENVTTVMTPSGFLAGVNADVYYKQGGV